MIFLIFSVLLSQSFFVKICLVIFLSIRSGLKLSKYNLFLFKLLLYFEYFFPTSISLLSFSLFTDAIIFSILLFITLSKFIPVFFNISCKYISFI